jgi:hypothetical protein
LYTGKLFLWLDSLSKAEKSRFREFVFSPYFNKNEDVRRFLTLLLSDEEQKLTKVKVFKHLFPGKVFDVRKITDQVYYLTRLVEEFLALQKFRNDEILLKINLLGETLDRNIEKASLFTSREIQDALNSTGYRDNDHFYYEYLYQNKMDKFFLGKGKVERDESLQKKTDSLDMFYISAKLRDCCEMLNRTQIIQSSYRMYMLEPISEFIRDEIQDYEQYPAIGIYYTILQMLQNPHEEKHYQKLVEMLSVSYKLFPAPELRDMYIYAQNYCIRKVNTGENKFYRELFEINKKLLENDLIYVGKYLTERDYKNIVSIALRLGEHAWTLGFIEQYKNEMAPDHRQNAHTYNLANYYYETGDHRKAIRLLRGVEFTDVYYNLDAKSMLLKIYFEEEEEETFFALCAAFKIYLTRNKLINEQNYNIYNNLLNFTKKAFYLKTLLPYQRKKDYRKKIELLKQKVEQTGNIVNSKWLLGQIEALEEPGELSRLV